MVSVWVALAGYVVTLVGALGAVLLAQRAENRRWYATQVSLVNVARADRLRGVYGKMAQAALDLRLVVRERPFRFDDESESQQNERHDKRIRDAMWRVGEVGGLVLVESSAAPVRHAYTLVADLTDEYMRADRHEPPGAERQDKLKQLSEAVSAMTDEVIRLASGHLTSLETPAPMESRKKLWHRHSPDLVSG